MFDSLLLFAELDSGLCGGISCGKNAFCQRLFFTSRCRCNRGYYGDGRNCIGKKETKKLPKGGGRVVSASDSETSVSSSTPAIAIIYDAYTSVIKKQNFNSTT